jgi:WhiB family transcriptional regulator, redox-sensing transcriptional regulator
MDGLRGRRDLPAALFFCPSPMRAFIAGTIKREGAGGMFASEQFDQETNDEEPVDEWADAQCRLGDEALTGLFFSDQIPDIARAKAICAECSLIVACLDGAIERREPWGVWGGQLFVNGNILAQKRKRGRPPKNRPVEDIQMTA